MVFEVRRDDIRQVRVVEEPTAELGEGQVRLAVERFALTANNVTYALAGDLLDYWRFFPAEHPWGRIPVIGVGSVVESAHPEIEAGGRYLGFFPMAGEHVIDAEPRGSGLRDIGRHRANHAVVYTDFQPVSGEDAANDDRIDRHLLLWAMFMTSFLVDDYLGDSEFHGAGQTLVTSASSKTSIALAACLAQRDGHRSIGLTSQQNRAFVERLGLYDQTVTYDDVGELDPTTRSGIVDMAGNSAVTAAVHHQFGDNLAFSIGVGATHWEAGDRDQQLPGPAPEFFFAPAHGANRAARLGADSLEQDVNAAFDRFTEDSRRWLAVEHRVGPHALETTYRDLLDARSDPASGYICSLPT